jgi:hypothetical protein
MTQIEEVWIDYDAHPDIDGTQCVFKKADKFPFRDEVDTNSLLGCTIVAIEKNVDRLHLQLERLATRHAEQTGVSMEVLLVLFQSDYGDEFDACGFALIEKGTWEQSLQLARLRLQKEGRVEIYFGTNEFIGFETFEQYEQSFKVRQVSEVEVDSLKRLFDIEVCTDTTLRHRYGIFTAIDE